MFKYACNCSVCVFASQLGSYFYGGFRTKRFLSQLIREAGMRDRELTVTHRINALGGQCPSSPHISTIYHRSHGQNSL